MAQSSKFADARVQRVYIAGPMTGHEKFNFPAFEQAATHLRRMFFDVVSPHEHDLELGFRVEDYDGVAYPPGFDLASVILWDLTEVARADAVYMLVGWERSSGAKLEHALAVYLKKAIWYQ